MEIAIKNFQKKIPLNRAKIRKTILNVLSEEGFKKNAQISVSFVTDSRIKALNRKFLKKDASTDVLAFDLSDAKRTGPLIADIIVSADTALRNAVLFNTSARYELNLYVIHGLLHLLGYDDHRRQAIKLMRKKEKEYAYS